MSGCSGGHPPAEGRAGQSISERLRTVQHAQSRDTVVLKIHSSRRYNYTRIIGPEHDVVL